MSPRGRIIPIFVPHLGCPNDCVFCNQRKISGSLFPAAGADVTSVLQEAKSWSSPAELAFYGGSFTAIPLGQQRELLAAAQPFYAGGFLTGIRVSTRPDAMAPEALAQLEEFGVQTVELGAQSMDDAVLQRCGRGHSAAQTVEAVRLLRTRGFRVVLQMMTGLPGSDPAGDLETARRIAALQPEGVRIYPTVVLQDTPLYELWRRGLYKAHSVEDAVETCAPILRLFQEAGIPVLRLGLNPTEELRGGAAAAGAYHPALGELVHARLYLEDARRLLRQAGPPGRAELQVHPRCLSKLLGQKRENLRILQAEFALETLNVVKNPALEPGKLAIRDLT